MKENKNIFRGLHFNGVEVLDLSFECNSDNEIFLDYLALFTSGYIVPTIKSNIEQIPLAKTKVSFDVSFNDENLKKLFDIIYEITLVNDVLIVNDIFVNNDSDRKKNFYDELEKLQKETNVNVPVCVLLKYLEHRSCIKSNILYGGFDYGLKELFNRKYYQSDEKYYNINIAHFIKYKEDLAELINVLQYVLIITKLLKFFLEQKRYLLAEKSTEEKQEIFLEELKKFSEKFEPKNIKKKSSISGSTKYSISGIVDILAVNYKNKYLSTEKNGRNMRIMLDIVLLNNFNTIIFQIKKAIFILKKIHIPVSCSTTWVEKLYRYFLKTFYNILRFSQPYIKLYKKIKNK